MSTPTVPGLPPVEPPAPGTVQIAATVAKDGRGELVVASTDLRDATVSLRAADALDAPAEVRPTTPQRLVDDVLDHLPSPEAAGVADERVVVPAELSVGLARALKAGDAAVVDAVCADQGWSGGPPPLLVELARSVRGSAQIIVRSATPAPLRYASLLIVPSGWVLLERRDELLVHTRVGRDDIARMLVSAVTAHADAVVAHREAGEAGDE